MHRLTMDLLMVILLALTAVSPISARAMPGTETTDTCIWEPCGAYGPQCPETQHKVTTTSSALYTVQTLCCCSSKK
ncbi:hypothetical protein DEU56DRAFT_492894 [Suillus clintonianus]|uniref:uncharacterized protein n=1 Tax=Suillus clintonianus TaxID=1904413 RepID=UPI001B8602C8|nr:uncharacterized protein DEU56DRAFT_492894 [Suillus clintonianus]KAG2129586.1 hypothetical protein DEU56DRAFT_492894 [Suillus clintonianus]